MAYEIDENGNITCYQGDTVVLTISGLDTTNTYEVYFQIRNSQGKPVGNQVHTTTLPATSSVFIKIPSATTDLLTVPAGQDTEEYYYGVKVIKYDNGTLTDVEDTLFLGANASFDTENTITVYPKKVDGE